MRTVNEMEKVALDARKSAIDAGGEFPSFELSLDEYCLLVDQPLQWQAMHGFPGTFCGLKTAIR